MTPRVPRQSWKRTCATCGLALNLRQDSHVTRRGMVAHWACAYPPREAAA